jgi:hypothetical protein
LLVAVGATVLFLLTAMTALNETQFGEPRLTFVWFALAMAALALAIGLPGDRNRG